MKTTTSPIQTIDSVDSLDALLAQRDHPIVVDFWAPWCGPCKMMAPILDNFASDHEGQVTVAKVNVDDAKPLAARYEIRSIPTLVIFQNGEEIDRLVSAVSQSELTKHFNQITR